MCRTPYRHIHGNGMPCGLVESWFSVINNYIRQCNTSDLYQHLSTNSYFFIKRNSPRMFPAFLLISLSPFSSSQVDKGKGNIISLVICSSKNNLLHAINTYGLISHTQRKYIKLFTLSQFASRCLSLFS